MADPVEQKARFEKWDRKYFAAGISHEMWPKAAEHAWQAAERSVVSDIVEKMQVRADTLGHPSFDYVRAFVELRRLIAELKKEYGL